MQVYQLGSDEMPAPQEAPKFNHHQHWLYLEEHQDRHLATLLHDRLRDLSEIGDLERGDRDLLMAGLGLLRPRPYDGERERLPRGDTDRSPSSMRRPSASRETYSTEIVLPAATSTLWSPC